MHCHPGGHTHACGRRGVTATRESPGPFLLWTLPTKGGSWPWNDSASRIQSPLFKKKEDLTLWGAPRQERKGAVAPQGLGAGGLMTPNGPRGLNGMREAKPAGDTVS